MDVDTSQLNGHKSSKRKARTSNTKSYKDATSDSEDDAPIVSDWDPYHPFYQSNLFYLEQKTARL